MTKPPAKQKMKKINEEEKNIYVEGKKCDRKKMYAWAQIAGTDFFSLHLENSTCSAGPSSSLRCQAHK